VIDVLFVHLSSITSGVGLIADDDECAWPKCSLGDHFSEKPGKLKKMELHQGIQ